LLFALKLMTLGCY